MALEKAMYGLDKATDLTFLVGKGLVQICVGLFQLILNFDDGVSISIEGEVEHIPVAKPPQSGSLQRVGCCLGDLLGKKIRGFEINDGGMLELTFSDGNTLRLYDSNPDAESYQITGPARNIVV